MSGGGDLQQVFVDSDQILSMVMVLMYVDRLVGGMDQCLDSSGGLSLSLFSCVTK